MAADLSDLLSVDAKKQKYEKTVKILCSNHVCIVVASFDINILYLRKVPHTQKGSESYKDNFVLSNSYTRLRNFPNL